MIARSHARAPSAQKPDAEARTGARERLRALSQRPSSGQSAVEAALSAPGAPLPERERREMEARFRRDFAAIRIHADPRAGEAAREALAPDRGIVVDPGLGQVEQAKGRAPIAHELAQGAQPGGAFAAETSARESDRNPALLAGAQRETCAPRSDTSEAASLPNRATSNVEHTEIRFGTGAPRRSAAASQAPPRTEPVRIGGAIAAPLNAKPVEDALGAFGAPLRAADRLFFEHHFGHDFGRVRVIVDAAAAESIGANAFAVGHKIIFGADRYAPDTASGRRLLAHELAHVVQQAGEGPANPADALERQANAAADFALVGRGVAFAGTSSPCALQMEEADGGSVQVIAKENGRIAVVLVKGGKVVKGYAELTPPKGKSAVEAAPIVRARKTSDGPSPSVDVVVPSDWPKPATNPKAKVRFVGVEDDKIDVQYDALIDKLREEYRAYLSDYEHHDSWFYEVYNPSMADRATEKELVGLLTNKDFFNWWQRKQKAQAFKQYERAARAAGFADAAGIKEMWANYAEPEVDREQAQRRGLHELKYDTFNTLKKSYAAETLLSWIASNPKAIAGEKGGPNHYAIDLGNGDKAELSEAQFRELRAEAVRQIETRLNTVRNQRDRYTSYKADLNPAERALDALAGAKLEGKSWEALNWSEKRARDAMKRDEIKDAIKFLKQSEAQGLKARREWNRYEGNRELAGELWITGIKVTAAAATVYVAAPTLMTSLGTTGVTLKAVGTGAGAGAAISAARIGAQVYDKSRPLPDWKEVTLEVGEGALTGAAFALAPEAGALLAAPGGAGMVDEFAQGHYATGAVDAATLFGPYAAEKTPKVLSWARPRIAAGAVALHTALEYPGLAGRPSGALPVGETPTASVESVAGRSPADEVGLGSQKARPGPGATNERSQIRAGERSRDVAGPAERVPEPPAGDEARGAREVTERDKVGALDEGQKPGAAPERKSSGPADLGADVSPEAPPKYGPKAPRRGPLSRPPASSKAGNRQRGGSTLADAAKQEGAVYEELTNGDVVWNLDAKGAMKVYKTCMADQPQFEVGIIRDVDTGEHFVVQGGLDAEGRPEVNLDEVLFSHPEFANRNLRLVRHYHPRGMIIDRVPSVEDFATLLRSIRLRREARQPLSSVIDYIDPITGQPGESHFEYTPGADKPYSIRYRATDGSWQTREFGNPPDLPGSDYERFLDNFTGRPDDRAPEPVSAAELGVGEGPAGGSAPPEAGIGTDDLGSADAKGSLRAPAAGTPRRRPLATKPAPPPPKQWRVVKVNPANPPETPKVGDHVILEFPGGERVWRDLSGNLVQEGLVGASRGSRAGTENQYYTQGQAKLAGPAQQRAHARGQGLGWESPYGIRYAPEAVNQGLQNHGIEGYLSDLNQAVTSRDPSARLRLFTVTRDQPGTLRLAEINYRVDVVNTANNDSHRFLEFTIYVEGTRTAPKIRIEKAAFSDNAVAAKVRGLGVPEPDVLTAGGEPDALK